MSKLNEVYRVVENPLEEQAGIELLQGEFDGLVYQYDKVQFVDGKPEVNFNRQIRRLPKGVEKTEENVNKILNNKELHNLMGDILLELLEEQIKNDELRETKRAD
tara:strand:- start:7972 stop:8286 length:315 start_codon:yes stop_codon:yes gene_type:complete